MAHLAIPQYQDETNITKEHSGARLFDAPPISVYLCCVLFPLRHLVVSEAVKAIENANRDLGKAMEARPEQEIIR